MPRIANVCFKVILDWNSYEKPLNLIDNLFRRILQTGRMQLQCCHKKKLYNRKAIEIEFDLKFKRYPYFVNYIKPT